MHTNIRKPIPQNRLKFLMLPAALCSLLLNVRAQQPAPPARPDTAKPCCCEVPQSVCLNKEQIIRPKTITIDFKTKQMAFEDKNVQKGDAIQVRVVNYNPYLYRLTISDVDTVAVVPASNGKLLLSLADPGNLSGIVANIVSSIGNATPARATSPPSDSMVEIGLAVPLNFLETVYGMDREDYRLASRPRVIDTALLVSDLQKQQLNLYIRSRKAVTEELIREIQETLYAYKRSLALGRVLYPDCNQFRLASAAEIQSIETSLTGFRAQLTAISDSLDTEMENYLFAMAPFRTHIEKNSHERTIDSLIRQFYAEAEKLLTAEAANISYERQADIITSLEVLSLGSSCFQSLPLFLTDEVKKLSIQFTPRFDSLALPAYRTDFLIPWMQKRVWGVSAGVYVSGLHGQEYTVRTNRTPGPTPGQYDTTYSVVREERSGRVEFGIDALAYTGARTGKGSDYLGLCFGAGLSMAARPKPRLLLGGSFITGEKNRLMVAVGVVGGFVSRLSSAYSTGDAYLSAPSGVLTDVIRPGVFLSLNYSFF